jgi:hypothetical protein
MKSNWPILSIRLPPQLMNQIDDAAIRMFSTFPRQRRRGERTAFVCHVLRKHFENQERQHQRAKQGA